FSHHARVAGGFALASSVCVMSPGLTLGAAAFGDDATARLGRRTADFFFATFLVLFLADFGLAMEFSWFDCRDPCAALRLLAGSAHRIPSGRDRGCGCRRPG